MHLSLDMLMESCSVSFNLSQLCHRKELFWQVCQLLSCYSVLWQAVKLSVVWTLQCSDSLWAVETSTSLVLQKGWYQGDVKTLFFSGPLRSVFKQPEGLTRSLQAPLRWAVLKVQLTSWQSSWALSLCLAADSAQTTWTGLLGVVLSNVVWFSSNEMYWIV